MTEEIKPPYQFSIKAECNAKGYVQPSIHVFSDELGEALDYVRFGLRALVKNLQQDGFKVATDIKDVVKEKD